MSGIQPTREACPTDDAHEFSSRDAAGRVCAQKKRPRPSEVDRPDVQAKRAAFLRWVRHIDPKRLVFLDEAGANIAMGRSHAWVQRGQECVEPRPMNWGDNLTMVGAIRRDGWLTLSTKWRSMTKVRFIEWVRCSLAERPHWDDERAARGDTANFVDLKFDSLFRVPPIRRFELDEPPFDIFRWDTQMSGVRIPAEIADALESKWQSRLDEHSKGDELAVLPSDITERWQTYWSDASEDSSWVERNRLRDTARADILPEIRQLVVSFLEGDTPLSQFRETFDGKTRNEWDLFGLKGMSGAMFLNKLLKHLPGQDELTVRLKDALAVPTTVADARQKIDDFLEFLDARIEEGVASKRELQPNRTPFFASACWHVQQPDRWPIIYQSARKAFRSDGLLGRKTKGADDYLAFARLFRELSQQLGISFWDLEHLCVRLGVSEPSDTEDTVPGENDDETPQRERIWLVAPVWGFSPCGTTEVLKIRETSEPREEDPDAQGRHQRQHHGEGRQ